MKQYLMPHVAHAVSSDTLLNFRRSINESKRRLLNKPHIADVFLHINDPYSFVLVQALQELAQRYVLRFRFNTVYTLNPEMFPEFEMWQANAFNDARSLSQLYGLNFPGSPLSKSDGEIRNFTNQLVNIESSDLALGKINDIFQQYWFTDTSEFQSVDVASQVTKNEARLNHLGHYMSAMIHYGGEWYWGVDRLDHLEKRANKLGLSTLIDPIIRYNRTYNEFCKPTTRAQNLAHATKPLTLYFSIRSPYSHLGLERAVALAKHYNIELIVKPVLPMLMRGLSVPKTKKMYIFYDTKREAKKYGIDYGYVADPLGAGVERCYALFKYAESKGKAVDYLLAYARAVNSQGVRSDTDKGIRQILSACHLDWEEAKPLLNNQSWRTWAEQNLQEMYALGLWGVPSFKYHNTAVWGQDRLFIIENLITNETSCA
ncbi:DsbA family protein [Alkalimarinus coralli]|uniref:DsbA family protein n=1 Tax=Alkalimarinus coralli TaxID=2935863 RepID=UPI00202B5861|nr:DsbA family protein [Alkalimarinus coralli]